MKQIGKLVVLCGKMGSGKSTEAERISAETKAVLLSEDRWLSSHYPGQINTFEDYLAKSKLIRPLIKSLVQAILRSGSDVVMDFPANTAHQRIWFKATAAEVGASLQIIFLNTAEELCLSRILDRTRDLPERAHFDNEETFRKVTSFFEEPREDEGIDILRIDTFV